MGTNWVWFTFCTYMSCVYRHFSLAWVENFLSFFCLCLCFPSSLLTTNKSLPRGLSPIQALSHSTRAEQMSINALALWHGHFDAFSLPGSWQEGGGGRIKWGETLLFMTAAKWCPGSYVNSSWSAEERRLRSEITELTHTLMRFLVHCSSPFPVQTPFSLEERIQ